MFVDAHTHLQNIDPESLSFGMPLRFINVLATAAGDWESVVSLCERRASAPRLLPSLGVHPWYAAVPDWPSTLAALRATLLAHPRASVGEIGVDRSPRALLVSPLEAQLRACREQLALACELTRSVSLHVVRAWEDVFALLQPYTSSAAPLARIPCILLHSFAGTPGCAARFEDMFPRGGRTRIIFSFQGAIVAPVVTAFARVLEACAPAAVDSFVDGIEAFAPPSVPARGAAGDSDGGKVSAVGALHSSSSAYAPPLPDCSGAGRASITLTCGCSPKPPCNGASAATMSVLAQLPPMALSFETDAPDQPFDADVSGAYRTLWRPAVLRELALDEAAFVLPLPRMHVIGVAATAPHAAAMGVNTVAATAAADSSATVADGALAGTSLAAPAAPLCALQSPAQMLPPPLPPNSPTRVIDVVIAAATWRVLKRMRPAKQRAGRGDPAVSPAAAPAVSAAAAAIDVCESLAAAGRWPSAASVAAEVRILCEASADAIGRHFGAETDIYSNNTPHERDGSTAIPR